jgi:hypothetical protein
MLMSRGPNGRIADRSARYRKSDSSAVFMKQCRCLDKTPTASVAAVVQPRMTSRSDPVAIGRIRDDRNSNQRRQATMAEPNPPALEQRIPTASTAPISTT